MKRYKVLQIYIHDAETQTYVVESQVTAQQILGGDDSGVVCLCLMPGMAEVLATRLNSVRYEQETIRPQENP